MTSIDVDLLRSAQINFENLEKAVPALSKHPYYVIAKAQLDEALGGKPAVEVIAEAARGACGMGLKKS